MSAVEIVIALLGLCSLIVFHELGHLIAARIVGIGADRFSLFFGPAMLKREWKGVEWRLGTIPLGGYVRLRGTRRLDTGQLRGLATHLSPEGSRALIAEVQTLERTHELPEALQALDSAESILAAESMPAVERSRADVWMAEARERTNEDSWWLAKPWKKIFVAFAGPLSNIGLCFILLSVAFMAGGAGGKVSNVVDQAVSGYSAKAAGIKNGDVIVAADGRRGINNVLSVIQSSDGKSIRILVRRGSQSKSLLLKPRQQQGRWIIGVSFREARVYSDPWTAARQTIGVMTGATTSTASLTRDAIIGQKDVSSQLMGPVGVVRLSASVVRTDARAYIGVLGLLSLSLALLNMLPVLPLDGGQIAIATLEALRRRRLSPTSEAAFVLAGMGIVLVLLMVGLGNDLSLR